RPPPRSAPRSGKFFQASPSLENFTRGGRSVASVLGLDARRFAGLTWTHERRIHQMSKLRRTNWFEGKEMSALWSLDGGARDFLLRVLGGAVTRRRRAGRLHFSRGLRDAEPDALKKMATL